MKTTRWKRSTATVLLAALLSQGCAAPGARLQYLLGDKQTLEHYKDYATAIEYPVETETHETDPNLFRAPRTITSMEEVNQRFISLEECIKLALSNSAILREDQNFASPANPLMSNPSRVASVYDSAIQETSFLFGNRGVEAALADFDPIFTTSTQWGRSEDPQNTQNLGLNQGDVLVDQTAQFQARLEKNLANSGTFAVEHDWNYSANNLSRLFPSAYTGFIQAEYRQPILAGAGTEFTRTAGPIGQGIRGVSGVSQGVLISRINADISLIDFEQSVTNVARDVENRYWDLYLALQLYHSEVSTFADLMKLQDKLNVRNENAAAGSEAVGRFYEADARVKGSLADVMSSEHRLRRLLGMPLNDGDFLTPVDKPSEAKLIPDWESSLLEALGNRPELRRQKWEIRSLELQLAAAKNLSRPRLDFVSQYRVNGFGDKLLGGNDDDGFTDAGYNSAYESLTQGDNSGWGLGFQFSMPLGLRLAQTQVRNYELRLRKARVVLKEQEQEIARELNNAILEMDRWYLLADSGSKRAVATARFAGSTEMRELAQEVQDEGAINRIVNSKISSRDADQGYLRSIIEYNKAITELNFRKGTLLQANSVYLAEGEWNPGAYEDAKLRAEAMTHALDNTHIDAVPSEFSAGPGPNSWEGRGIPDRPHIPGVVEALSIESPASVPGYSVPVVPKEAETKIGEPQDTNPMPAPRSAPKNAPGEKKKGAPEQLFDTTDFETPSLRIRAASQSATLPPTRNELNRSDTGKAKL